MTEDYRKVNVRQWASLYQHQPEIHLLVSCMPQNYEVFYQLNVKNKEEDF